LNSLILLIRRYWSGGGELPVLGQTFVIPTEPDNVENTIDVITPILTVETQPIPTIEEVEPPIDVITPIQTIAPLELSQPQEIQQPTTTNPLLIPGLALLGALVIL